MAIAVNALTSGTSEHASTSFRAPIANDPIYFISQLQEKKVVGVLVNARQNRTAPTFMGMGYAQLGNNPLIGQLWSVPFYHWTLDDSPILKVSARENIGYQASSELRGIKLVRDVSKVRTDTATIRCVLDVPSNRGVEVEGKRLVGGVRLGVHQCKGGYTYFTSLKPGDKVEVEMVQLPDGCYVGSRYALPDVEDCNGEPLLRDLLKSKGVAKPHPGDYFPIKIRVNKKKY